MIEFNDTDGDALVANDTAPVGWTSATLIEVCEINPRMTWHETFSDDLQVTFVPMAAVDELAGVIARSEVRSIAEVWKGYTRFAEGDVLFAKITPCMENGKAAVAQGLANGLGFGSTEFHVLRPTQAVIAKWIFYFVRQQSFRDEAGYEMTGTAGQLRVPTKYLANVVLPLAPLNEQHRIVEAIETQFTRLDTAIAALKRLQANLKRYKASVLKAACEGRLVPQDPDDEHASELLARILQERRAKWEEEQQAKGKDPRKLIYPEPAAPDTSDLPELPEGWVWASWEQVSPRVTVGHVGKMFYAEEGVPFLRSQNVRENRFEAKGLLHITPEFHEKLKKSKLSPGDLAVVRSGSVGVTCVIPDHLEDANCADLVIIKKPKGLISEYGAYYMNSLAKQRVRAGQVGIALIHFNTQSVANLPVPIPPYREQERIVDAANKQLSIIDEFMSAVDDNIQRAERLRQSILKQAFTGRLVSQDPNDEPAGELLKRIQHEREQRKKQKA